MRRLTGRDVTVPNRIREEVAENEMKPRLQEKYDNEILPGLVEKLGRQNRLALPRLQKIVVNMGVGSAIQEKKTPGIGRRRYDPNYRSETGHHASSEIGRRFSPAGGDVDRLQGHVAKAAYV